MSSAFRKILVCLLAVLAVGAVAASAASAEGWTVKCHKVIAANKGKGEFNNSTCTEAGGSKEFTKKLLAGESAEFSEFEAGVKTSRIKLAGVTVECKKISFGAEPTKDFIEGTNGGSIKAGGIKFEECEVTKPVKCKLASGGTIATKEPLKLTLNEASTEVTFTTNLAGGTFAEFTFTTEEGCGTLAGKTVKVTGETVGKISNPAACEEKHVLSIAENTQATNKLKAAGSKVEEFDQEITLPGVENLNGVDVGDECWDA